MSVRLFVCNNMTPIGQIFIKFVIDYFSKICLEFSILIYISHESRVLCVKIYVHLVITTRWILLEMKKIFRTNLYRKPKTFSVQEYGKYGTARQIINDNVIRCKGIACWITKATNTHWKYVILIAFPRQQWLHKHASMLRHK